MPLLRGGLIGVCEYFFPLSRNRNTGEFVKGVLVVLYFWFGLLVRFFSTYADSVQRLFQLKVTTRSIDDNTEMRNVLRQNQRVPQPAQCKIIKTAHSLSKFMGHSSPDLLAPVLSLPPFVTLKD